MDIQFNLTWSEKNTSDKSKMYTFKVNMFRIFETDTKSLEISVNHKELIKIKSILIENKIHFTESKVTDKMFFIKIEVNTDIYSFDSHTEFRIK